METVSPDSGQPNPREVGARVEHLLADLAEVAEPSVTERAEELVRALMELYGTGLARIVDLAWEADGEPEVPTADSGVLGALASDELVSSLLILHGLHPLSTEQRVQQALEGVRPYLRSHAGGIELLGIDEFGVVQMRLEGTCDGCPSSAVTVRMSIERAIEEAAPEITAVAVEGLVETPPAPAASGGGGGTLIPAESLFGGPSGGSGHGGSGHGGSGHGGARADPGPVEPEWTALAELAEIADGELRRVDAGGAAVLGCRAGGQLYAYRDACARCTASLAGASLAGTVLTCANCDGAYDVQLAGRSVGGGSGHLDPLPLLGDGAGVRVAVDRRVPVGAPR